MWQISRAEISSTSNIEQQQHDSLNVIIKITKTDVIKYMCCKFRREV